MESLLSGYTEGGDSLEIQGLGGQVPPVAAMVLNILIRHSLV